jgi:hypothetical protein
MHRRTAVQFVWCLLQVPCGPLPALTEGLHGVVSIGFPKRSMLWQHFRAVLRIPGWCRGMLDTFCLMSAWF